MKRLRPRLFNGLAVASLLMCLTSSTLWVRSWSRYEGIELGISLRVVPPSRPWAAEYPLYEVGVDTGHLFVRCRLPGFEYEGLRVVSDVPSYNGWTGESPSKFVGWSHDGEWLYAVPLWLPVMLFVTAAAALAGKQRKRNLGECAHCGYDLRATPDRCPECGTIPTAVKSAT